MHTLRAARHPCAAKCPSLPDTSDKNRDKRSVDNSQPNKPSFERSTIDSKAPQISSQPEDWDGFSDPFWNLGQVLMWVATHNLKWVDEASDAGGALGIHTTSSEMYGLVAAGRQIEDQRITLKQANVAIKQIWQFCVNGTLNAATQGEGISPDKWRTLEIRVLDHIPVVVLRKYPEGPGAGAHATPDLRFRREEVLRCFPPPDGSLYNELPADAPSQQSVRTAYLVLKRMYPDGRIPAHISDEALARRAREFSTYDTITRDDVRRALGKRK
jgi:hypothetical protein